MTGILKATAYHEAGHAVAFHRLFSDRVSGDLSIEPKEGTLGRHKSEDYDSYHPDTDVSVIRDAAAREAVCYCAGYAGSIIHGLSDVEARLGCDSDFEQAKETISVWNLEPLETYLSRAIELLLEPQNVRAVQRLATELLEHTTLDAYEVEVLIDVIDGESSEDDLVRFRQLISGAGTGQARY